VPGRRRTGSSGDAGGRRGPRSTPAGSGRRGPGASAGAAGGPFRIKRVYEPAEAGDGARVLIMRLWPRGIRREHVDVWLKELGPVRELLRAFLDRQVVWPEYRRRYLAGLGRPEAQDALRTVRDLAGQGPVTLLCGCPDPDHCHRSLLQAYLRENS